MRPFTARFRPRPYYPRRAGTAIGSEARKTHDGSSRYHGVAWRDGREEPRGTDAYLNSMIEERSGEPAAWLVHQRMAKLVAAANRTRDGSRSAPDLAGLNALTAYQGYVIPTALAHRLGAS